ncbi:cell division protein ZapA [Psychromonas sp.]|uniref:cell division protein ZapA n=1 Tax=Psychromonas sp. TaxID=1884585 RepID=UPI003563E362
MAHLDISILGQQYKIACPEGEELALQQSVDQFNEKIRNIKSSARTLRNEQVIVLAALNFCHELHVERTKHKEHAEKLEQRLQTIHDSIDLVLTKESKK